MAGYATYAAPAVLKVPEGKRGEAGTISLLKALVISEPPEGAFAAAPTTLRWQAVEGARCYLVTLSDQDAGYERVLEGETTATSLVIDGSRSSAGRFWPAGSGQRAR